MLRVRVALGRRTRPRLEARGGGARGGGRLDRGPVDDRGDGRARRLQRPGDGLGAAGAAGRLARSVPGAPATPKFLLAIYARTKYTSAHSRVSSFPETPPVRFRNPTTPKVRTAMNAIPP